MMTPHSAFLSLPMPVLSLPRGDPHWTRQGMSLSNHMLRMRVMPTLNSSLSLGISVKRKMGKAVTRNLIKRRLRHAFRHVVSMPCILCVHVKSADVASCSFTQLCDGLKDLFNDHRQRTAR